MFMLSIKTNQQGTLKLKKGKLSLGPDSYFLADGISADLFLLKV